MFGVERARLGWGKRIYGVWEATACGTGRSVASVPVRSYMQSERSAVHLTGGPEELHYFASVPPNDNVAKKRLLRRSTVPLTCRGHFSPRDNATACHAGVSTPLSVPADRAATRLPLARDIAYSWRRKSFARACLLLRERTPLRVGDCHVHLPCW